MLRLLALTTLMSTTIPTYNKDVKPIFEKRCAQCHNASWADKDWSNYTTTVSNKEKIKERVIIKKDMPPANITEMTEEERKTVESWIENGTKK